RASHAEHNLLHYLRNEQSAEPLTANADDVLFVCAGRRRLVLEGAQRRGHVEHGAGRPAVWRPDRQREGCVRKYVVSRNPAERDTIESFRGRRTTKLTKTTKQIRYFLCGLCVLCGSVDDRFD